MVNWVVFRRFLDRRVVLLWIPYSFTTSLDEIGSDVLDFWAQLFNVDICLRGQARGHELLEQIVDIFGKFKALEVGDFVIQVENLLLEMSLLASHVETKRRFGTLHGDHSNIYSSYVCPCRVDDKKTVICSILSTSMSVWNNVFIYQPE